MPYIKSIVEHINTTLTAGKLNRHSMQGGKYYGLSKQVTVSVGDSLIPAIFDISGNEIDVTIDDTYPIHLYHRITQPIIYAQPAKEESFGDGTAIKEIVTLACVVYADPKRIELTAEDLSFLIVTGMPSRFTTTDIGSTKVASVLIGVLGSETSPAKVMNTEYGGGKEFDPEKILISINYRIEITAEKDCIDCTTC